VCSSLIDKLPLAKNYEISYMHRETLTHVLSSKDLVITASIEGVVKFWKKNNVGTLDFIKSFRAHSSPLTAIALSSDGCWLSTGSFDKTIKIFDVENFDMIEILRYDEIVGHLLWWKSELFNSFRLIVANKIESLDDSVLETDSPIAAPLSRPFLTVFDPWNSTSKTLSESITSFMKDDTEENIPVISTWCLNSATNILVIGTDDFRIKYLLIRDMAESNSIQLEDITPHSSNQLSDFKSESGIVSGISFSPDNRLFVTMSSDRFIRVFDFDSGKMVKKLDDRITVYSDAQQSGSLPVKLDDLEFGRRLAIERDLQRSPYFNDLKAIFDQSSQFIIFPSLIGIKVMNLESNRLVRLLSREDSLRPLQIALYQGIPVKKRKNTSISTLDMVSSSNPTLSNESDFYDPTVIFTAYRKSRVYLVTRREPIIDSESGHFIERDVLNEKPVSGGGPLSKTSETEKSLSQKQQPRVILRTSKGDITLQLTQQETPKTVENFLKHCDNGYFNNVIFHRVIKNFMIQTGDPQGDGTGGESIWGGEFEDEFHPDLKHSRPYILSMANCGPNTNGSQFFITTIKCPWLDNKHTVFGKVINGTDVVDAIENVKCDDLDRPVEPIKILQVEVFD
jgi:peptidylprolyl isomerase domain and WD repeat-containing protein 1